MKVGQRVVWDESKLIQLQSMRTVADPKRRRTERSEKRPTRGVATVGTERSTSHLLVTLTKSVPRFVSVEQREQARGCWCVERSQTCPPPSMTPLHNGDDPERTECQHPSSDNGHTDQADELQFTP